MTITSAVPQAVIDAATAVLCRGGLVAFPTETVYGLGGNACDDEAVGRIFAAKARPSRNPLIAHVTDRGAAERHGRFSSEAVTLADAFWPGPLTLVLPANPGCGISALARAGLDSVAMRVPSHPVARALLAAAGFPVAAPSANRSGRISPTTAEHVQGELGGRVDMIVDGGPCVVGLESTIVSCLGAPTLLRPGGIPRETIEAVLGRALATPARTEGRPVSPGLLASHYAPNTGVRLNAAGIGDDEAVLDFAGQLAGWRARAPYRDLSPHGDLAEAAARLFACLRELDAAGAAVIAVAPIPTVGLGLAIADRLARAAAPRPTG